MVNKTKIKKDELPWGVGITQLVFLVLSILCTLLFVIELTVQEQTDLKFIWTGITAAVFWVLFYGTYKTKSWVVTPLLAISAFFFISNLFGILTAATTTAGELFYKVIKVLMTIFFLLQLYIFTRPKTKGFFKEKAKEGSTLDW